MAESRSVLHDLFVRHGGRFEASLKKQSATHLVAAEPQGEKYKRALEWKSVAVVNESWVHDSVAEQG